MGVKKWNLNDDLKCRFTLATKCSHKEGIAKNA
jgi:hypothetical protein